MVSGGGGGGGGGDWGGVGVGVIRMYLLILVGVRVINQNPPMTQNATQSSQKINNDWSLTTVDLELCTIYDDTLELRSHVI